MKRPTEICPGCESEQSFPLHQRDTDIDGVIKVYIKCTVCPWSKVVRKSTPGAERLRVRLAHAKRQANWQTRRHGQPFAGTLNTIRIIEKEIVKEMAGVD